MAAATDEQYQGNSKIMSQLTDQDFVYAYLQEYQDDELASNAKARFEKIIAADDQLLARYSKTRGLLQTAFARWELSPENQHDLRCIVEDDVSRADHEASNIRELGTIETRGTALRYLFMAAVIGLIAAAILHYFGPRSRPDFAALESLTYEAEKFTAGRANLDLPTEDINEVRNFIAKYPNLGFKPLPVYALTSENWSLDGASVISYEFIKIPVLQYASFSAKSNKMYLFQFNGHLSDLPSSEKGKAKDLTFQAYANNEFNVVAWQAHEDIVGMMVGRESTQDLAKYARLALHRR